VGSLDIVSHNPRIISFRRFPLASDLIWITTLYFKKIYLLILFSPTIKSSPSLVDQIHTLNLVLGLLGLVWSHNILMPISQRSHKIQVSIKISRSRNHLDKAYSQSLALRIFLALPRETITLLPKQTSHTIESLLWIGLGNHISSFHWHIHYRDSSRTGSPPISEIPEITWSLSGGDIGLSLHCYPWPSSFSIGFPPSTHASLSGKSFASLWGTQGMCLVSQTTYWHITIGDSIARTKP